MKQAKDYIPIIGLEIHIELATKSKMFCSCKASHFKIRPNTHTCPVCLGLPGALPVANAQAIEWCQLIGLALNCQLNLKSKFDRKHYFYPDLPKGYQISQYDQPLCYGGKVKIRHDAKNIRINRVHLEEDTGKLIHTSLKGKEVSLVDFNRSGVPLVEIVTHADFRSAAEVDEFLKKVQQIVRYLGVSNCEMEKGSMRLEVNMSLAPKKKKKFKLPNYKVEIKNINSFKFVQKAIESEFKRQVEILSSCKTPLQETRGFSQAKGVTLSQRSKEEAHDYRYFPEPDIPPLSFTRSKFSKLKSLVPELPDQKLARFIKVFSLSYDQAKILTQRKKFADFFELAVQAGKKSQIKPKTIANLLINKKIDINKISAEKFISQIKRQASAKITNKQELKALVKEVIIQNPQALADFRQGKRQVVGVFIGAVMRKSQGKADAKTTQEILLELLKEDDFPEVS